MKEEERREKGREYILSRLDCMNVRLIKVG